MSLGTHAIKIKEPNAKVWRFLTSDGRLTRLRVHAALATPERCEEFASRIRADNPDHGVKVVAFR